MKNTIKLLYKNNIETIIPFINGHKKREAH